jgi:hypothetical protein
VADRFVGARSKKGSQALAQYHINRGSFFALARWSHWAIVAVDFL